MGGMGSGRRPTPTRLKLLSGTARKHRMNAAEPQPSALASLPDPPADLDELACAEWRRIGPELVVCGVLTVVDLETFAVYCQAVSDRKTYRARMRELGPVIALEDRKPRLSPYVRLEREARETMARAAAELGITPSSRSRVHRVDPAREMDEFDLLFAREHASER
jgi:P27 family predicted phage terminase small subunit